jgi:hypothetical protein
MQFLHEKCQRIPSRVACVSAEFQFQPKEDLDYAQAHGTSGVFKPLMNTPFLFLPLAALFLASCATTPLPGEIRREFPADGITDVVFRASAAETATVTMKGKPSVIAVSGVAAGGTGDYRSPDTSWHGSPAAQWGLTFASRRYGSTLVISTENETAFTNHRYTIDDLRLELPPSVRFVSQVRQLTDNGAPDLSAPE